MVEGRVVAVCTSPDKGDTKTAVDRAELIANHGIEGDAHAGPWHRQVSLLAEGDIDGMRERGLDLEPGDFGENLVVDGLDLDRLGIGSTIRVGDGELEITQIGKMCHSRCAIYYQAGDCIMPRAGVFAMVVAGGTVRPGSEVSVIHRVGRDTVMAGVITVSDSVSAGTAVDTAGPAVGELLIEALQAHVAWSGVVPDEEDEIARRIVDLAERGIDLVVTAGGTGCALRDRTPEATRTVIDREIPGLAEAMRLASSKITSHAWLQRGLCGILGSTVVINLPGSRKAAVENLEVIVEVLRHAIQLLRGHTAHPETDAERAGANLDGSPDGD